MKALVLLLNVIFCTHFIANIYVAGLKTNSRDTECKNLIQLYSTQSVSILKQYVSYELLRNGQKKHKKGKQDDTSEAVAHYPPCFNSSNPGFCAPIRAPPRRFDNTELYDIETR